MLKPKYRNRGGQMVQPLRITHYVTGDMLCQIVLEMLYFDKKATRSSVEKVLRETLSIKGSDGVYWLTGGYDEEEVDSLREKADRLARDLFPDFFI